jgi:hypothetical protein
MFERHFVWLENALVVAVVVVLSAGFFHWNWQEHVEGLLNERRAVLYGTLTTLEGALLGFAITAQTVLVMLHGDRRLARVQSSDRYHDLTRLFQDAVSGLGLAATAAFLALVFDREGAPSGWAFVATTAGAVLAILRVSNLVWVLGRLMDVVTKRTAG